MCTAHTLQCEPARETQHPHSSEASRLLRRTSGPAAVPTPDHLLALPENRTTGLDHQNKVTVHGSLYRNVKI